MINLAIIGGGPAGLTAGLYATRGGIKDVVLFEKGMPGGQITGSSEIENYPGVKEIKSGLDFMEPWQEQCFRFGLKHEMVEISKITQEGEFFTIHHNDGNTTEAKAVILRGICLSQEIRLPQINTNFGIRRASRQCTTSICLLRALFTSRIQQLLLRSFLMQ